jgi:hypothetical protein
MYNNFSLYVYELCFHKKKIMRDPIERDYIIIAFIRQLTWDHYFDIIVCKSVW